MYAVLSNNFEVIETHYGQLSPCRHLAKYIADTPVIWSAAKSPARINYGHLRDLNSRY